MTTKHWGLNAFEFLRVAGIAENQQISNSERFSFQNDHHSLQN